MFCRLKTPDLAIWDNDLNRRNRIHCDYVIGLGYLGMENIEKAVEHINIVKKWT